MKLSREKLSELLDIPPYISQLLVNRGINTEDELYDFFLNEDLSNPFLLPNMKKVADRMMSGIDAGEKITIFGDFDLDGILSASILFLYLKELNANVDIYIPPRDGERGISREHIDKIIIEQNPSLIITVDTGISAKGMDDYCAEKSIDLIITDHHEIIIDKAPSNSYAIINPKLLKKDPEKLKTLSGAGISFFIVRALNSRLPKKKSLIDYNVLAMLATISDMVPLTKNNRIIVKDGINLLYDTNLAGLNVLIDSLNFFFYPTVNDISFQLIPILNSASRLNKIDIILSLIMENNILSHKYAKELRDLNEERKKRTSTYFDTAYQEAKKYKDANYLIIYNKNFDSGFLGLIANKIAQEFKLPVMIGKEGKDSVAFSMRQDVSSYNFSEFIEKNSDILEGGGHKMAAGFRVKKKDITTLFKRCDEFFQEKNTEKSKRKYEMGLVYSEDIIKNFIKFLPKFQPFGNGVANPSVRFSQIPTKKIETKIIQNKHLSIKVGDKMEIMYFFLSPDEIKEHIEKIKNSNEISLDIELHTRGGKLVGYSIT